MAHLAEEGTVAAHQSTLVVGAGLARARCGPAVRSQGRASAAGFAISGARR